MKINTISPEKNEYLQIVTSIAKSPELFHYAGTIPDKRQPSVAIVGTRKPTPYGKEVTYRLASDLASRGVVIVSGLALGIDAVAHSAALEAGGTTIAILGNGLPDIYPAFNASLARRIIEGGGALLSEYPPHTKARPYHFLERNRLVAGLSDAVIITEAALRSGTLNTAAHAIEQGKDVFVVPGNITNPLSAGCNALIKQGAFLLTEANDVLDWVAPKARDDHQTQLPLGRTELETKIIGLIAQGIREGDELLERAACDPTDFATSLTMLELSGSIRALGANRWTLG